MSAVQAGVSIARRFVLDHTEPYDVEGVTRWVAHDSRLDRLVNVDIITSSSPSAVVAAAGRARVLRDKRLARVLAAGHDRVPDTEDASGERFHYVVTERPSGAQLSELLGHVVFAPQAAAALVGEAAASLSAAALVGEHHGLIRAQALTVTDGGRVMVSGFGVDGELAVQAGRGRGTTEKADAVALAQVYLTAITGLPVEDVTITDLPEDLTGPALKFAKAVIKGSGPKRLADITLALGGGNTPVLRQLAAEAPSLWWPPAPVPPIQVEAVVESVVALGEPEARTDEIDIVVRAPGVITRDPASTRVDGVDEDLDGELLAPAELAIADTADVLDAEVVSTDELPVVRPRTRFGGAVDDIDEFHDIVADQNREVKPTVAQAALTRLHQRFPESTAIARATEAANHRAEVQAPINAGPLLLGLALTVVVVVAVLAMSRIGEPFEPDFDRYNNPLNTYPAFTHGITASPSPVE